LEYINSPEPGIVGQSRSDNITSHAELMPGGYKTEYRNYKGYIRTIPELSPVECSSEFLRGVNGITYIDYRKVKEIVIRKE
jgi:hypothetical protein